MSAIGSVKRDAKRGTWYFVVDAPGPAGKRRQVLRRGFERQKDAQEALDRFRGEISAGHVPVPDAGTVGAFAVAWIDALPAEGVEPATVKHYSEAIRRLLPAVGTIPLQDLEALDLDGVYGQLLDAGRSARTVRASHVAARKMLAEALRVGKVGRNVAEHARPPRAKAARAKQFTTWTVDQLEAFLEAVDGDEHHALWTVAAWTGIRRGEVVALRWDDLDEAGGALVVSRSVGKGLDGLHDKAPKSDAGRRRVELDSDLLGVLRAHRQAQRERRVALGPGWRDHGLIFCEVDGTALHPDRISKRWAYLVRAHAAVLGLPAIRLHDLRHSHATQLLAAGVRADVVTERLGHASVAFTLQTYAHRFAGDQRSGLERLRVRSAEAPSAFL